MQRELWKGHLSFGLISIPIEIVTAESAKAEKKINFDLIDRRDHDHVGYLKINKNTGKKVAPTDIVKAFKLDSGEYVIFEKEEIDQLKIKGTKTIDIQEFIETSAVDPIYFDRPYYLVPSKGGEKSYVLLRDTLEKTGKFAVGLIVLHAKQHLALIGASGRTLFLELIRFDNELKKPKDIELPPENKIKISTRESQMAERLVAELSSKWKPSEFKDTYFEEVMDAVKKKSKDKIEVSDVEAEEAEDLAPKRSKVTDLLPLLEKSLRLGSKRKSKGKMKRKVTSRETRH